MFENLIVHPIFNLLVLINALVPGHNFGVALIIFTILVRILMWPLVRKQLHNSKVMQAMRPEMKRIKKEAKGDRQKEMTMLGELYKEKGISQTGSLGIMIVQFMVLIGLYFAVRKLVNDPHSLLTFSYSWLHGLPWLKDLMTNIGSFDETLLGVINLTKPALSNGGAWYFPGLLLVAGSAFAQYKTSVQLMPKGGRKVREILADPKSGKEVDQVEMNAAFMRSARFLIPGMIFLFTLGLPCALSLYWLVGGTVAYFQQKRVLEQDEVEMDAMVSTPSGKKAVLEGEVIESTPKPKAKKKSSKSAKKRRK